MLLRSSLFVLIVIQVHISGSQSKPQAFNGATRQDSDIEYKNVDQYMEIWSSKGSKGQFDVSIWRQDNLVHDYCSLGDVATNSFSKPTVRSISVNSKNTYVKHPVSFTQIWNNEGMSGASNVAVWKMNPPFGYICLGAAAMGSHSVEPDKTKYCCINNQYVVPADVEKTYSDEQSGAQADVSLWTVVKGTYDDGIPGYNFLAVKGASKPSEAKLLNRKKAVSVDRQDSQTPNADSFQFQDPNSNFGSSVSGSYSYTSPDGSIVNLSYRCDELGCVYNEPLIPQAPPAPAHVAELLRITEEQRAAGITFE